MALLDHRWLPVAIGVAVAVLLSLYGAFGRNKPDA